MSCVFGLCLCAQNTWKISRNLLPVWKQVTNGAAELLWSLTYKLRVSDWIIRRTCHIWKTGRLSTSGQDSDASKCLAWPPGIPGNSTWRTECELIFWCGEDLSSSLFITAGTFILLSFFVCFLAISHEDSRWLAETSVLSITIFALSVLSWGQAKIPAEQLLPHCFSFLPIHPPLLFYIRFETLFLSFSVHSSRINCEQTTMNPENKHFTVNPSLTDTLLSGQLHLRTLSPPRQKSVFTHSRRRTISSLVKTWTRTLLKRDLWYLFIVFSLSGHSMLALLYTLTTRTKMFGLTRAKIRPNILAWQEHYTSLTAAW